MLLGSSTYIPVQEEETDLDYKLFIREFERYRNGHPEQSFQEALDKFMQLHRQQNSEAGESLA